MKLQENNVQLSETEMAVISAGGMDQAGGQPADGGSVTIEEVEDGPTIGGVTGIPDPGFGANRLRRRHQTNQGGLS